MVHIVSWARADPVFGTVIWMSFVGMVQLQQLKPQTMQNFKPYLCSQLRHLMAKTPYALSADPSSG